MQKPEGYQRIPGRSAGALAAKQLTIRSRLGRLIVCLEQYQWVTVCLQQCQWVTVCLQKSQWISHGYRVTHAQYDWISV